MNINWKLRFKNKATLLTLILAIVAFVYQILGIVGVTVPISQDQVTQIIGLVINVLVGLGIVVDPTTAGVGDSNSALAYTEPNGASTNGGLQ